MLTILENDRSDTICKAFGRTTAAVRSDVRLPNISLKVYKYFLLALLFSIVRVDCFLNNNQFSARIHLRSIVASDTIRTRTRRKIITCDTTKNPEEIFEASSTDGDDSVFDIIAGVAASCLFESDKRRDNKREDSNLISSENASILQKAIDRLKLKFAEERVGLDRDKASMWIRWMKSSPTPMIIDLSPEFRAVANVSISDANLDLIEQSRAQFSSRMSARLILLPSGSSLSRSLREPPDSLLYGKLLYGGVTRYCRSYSSNSRRPTRRIGECTVSKISVDENIPAWIQYGGEERMYSSVDIGSAALLEIILAPRGQVLPIDETASYSDMVVKNFVWKPQEIFDTIHEEKKIIIGNEEDPDQIDVVSGHIPISQAGKNRNDAFEADFKVAVGGLQPQIDAIVRRVLDGRVIRPAGEDDGLIEQDEMTTALNTATLDAQELAILGLTPVRGLLLYGKPGTGKTLLARQISRALRARAPKIVSAPELLDRWVGGSEKLVRELFSVAEAELAACNGDVTRSALHVIVIDEIDAVFRRRSAGEDSGEQTRASVVNQILSKLDGVNAIDNVLIIGMTNRRELLDEALLRPGRLEVQIEIPLPDQEGRREILKIHFDPLRKKGRLSKPVCCAIDNIPRSSKYESKNNPTNINLKIDNIKEDGKERKRDAVKRGIYTLFRRLSPRYDLAVETAGFSGADIAGLVRSAGSMALSRARKNGKGVNDLLITLEDTKQAIEEAKK